MTKKYYNAMKKYRDAVRDASDEYDLTLQKNAALYGSPRYAEIEREAAAKRDATLSTAKRETLDAVREVCATMRTNAKARKTVAPTAEQLAILQALKMREKVSAGELRHAANSLAGCPLALSVLDELAAQCPGAGRFNNEMSDGEIDERVTALERGALAFLRGEKSPHFDTEQECVAEFAAFPLVQDEKTGVSVDLTSIARFSEAVNGEEVQQ